MSAGLRPRASVVPCFLLLLLSKGTMIASAPHDWTELTPLPTAIAGQCAGTVSDRLVVAGGSSWTAPPWANGVKSWSGAVLALDAPQGAWQQLAALPHAMAYGASAAWKRSLLCVGGQNATEVFQTVLRLHERDRKLVVDELAPLPRPLTNTSAAVVGETLFVVGGQHGTTPDSASNQIWSLALEQGAEARWRPEPTPPWTHARILPVAISCGTSLYVMSGADLRAGSDGAPVRTYLTDVWKRADHGKWRELESLPQAAVAASGICGVHGSPILFSGDDGVLAPRAAVLRDAHPGFAKEVRELEPASGRWRTIATMPASLVTTAVAHWRGLYVVAGGEQQPGHRSTRVFGLAVAHEGKQLSEPHER